MKIFLILIKIFVIAALLIISNGNLALSVPENRAAFAEQYTAWLLQLSEHASVVAGYVIGNEWLPDVSSNTFLD